MKKYLRNIEWFFFALCLGSLLVYIFYTIHIKVNPQTIITDRLVGTLKTYLIIALISLFIGLFIVLIKKILFLKKPTTIVDNDYSFNKTSTYKRNTDIIEVNNNKVISEQVKEEKIKIRNDEVIPTKEKIVKETVTEKVVTPKKYTYEVTDSVCPECGGGISKKAAICPHCGILFDREVLRILKKHEKRKRKIPLNPFWIVFNLILIVILIIFIIIVSKAIYRNYITNKNNINSYITQRR